MNKFVIIADGTCDLNEEMLKEVYKDVAAFADSEGLGCHAAAVRARFED